MELLIKSGSILTAEEFKEINDAWLREFKEGPCSLADVQGEIFFLLKDKNNILAIGGLIPVEGIKFQNKKFNILGIGGIVANEKGKSYGKKIMLAIKRYLIGHNKTGVGFCGKHNIPFYKKCGFEINDQSVERFIHFENGQRIDNDMHKENDFILYYDSDDQFMKTVRENQKEDVVLPRPANW